ncbi:Gpr1 family protein [Artomyces pyxidatus]|uniref:Gpr1 family protein n=1 Tax=Artomyces pyxidatus TaxID=48021 RepID=A0ACB8SLI2_9AGAM|nr:Gpr1 family protein [Artomyces pyxidatus]
MSDVEKAHHEEVNVPEGYEPGYGFPSQRRRHALANPGPLGLFSFASTTLVLSLFNANVRHITTPNVVVGMALFAGGLAQLLAGMWEFAVGNTFGASVFSMYSTFWMSFATILIPNSGIAAAYAAAGGNQEDDAIAIFLTSWAIVTLLFFIGSLRKNAALSSILFFLFITFILLAVGDYQRKVAVTKAGGYTGIITGVLAYYTGFAELMAPEDLFQLPVFNTSKRRAA